jgi:hypothetical protein
MSGRPEERRRHAMVCSRLAESLPDGRARQMFTALAEAWLELAVDLENSQAFFACGFEPALPLHILYRRLRASSPSIVLLLSGRNHWVAGSQPPPAYAAHAE